KLSLRVDHIKRLEQVLERNFVRSDNTGKMANNLDLSEPLFLELLKVLKQKAGFIDFTFEYSHEQIEQMDLKPVLNFLPKEKRNSTRKSTVLNCALGVFALSLLSLKPKQKRTKKVWPKPYFQVGLIEYVDDLGDEFVHRERFNNIIQQQKQ